MEVGVGSVEREELIVKGGRKEVGGRKGGRYCRKVSREGV